METAHHMKGNSLPEVKSISPGHDLKLPTFIRGTSMADGIEELKQWVARLEQSLEWSEEENSIMKKAATAMLLTKAELESQLADTLAKLDSISKKGGT